MQNFTDCESVVVI